MKISPARVAAFDVLKRIEIEAAYSSVLLAKYEGTLSPLDRGLCHELVLGVLRHQIWLDRAIDMLSNGKKLDLAVRLSLRLGLYQIKFLDKIPQHAAVSDSVDLVQRAKKTSAKGFVNALLRRASRETIALIAADDADRIVLETSHPRWLVERWIEQFGVDDTTRIASANNSPGGLAFRFIGDAVEMNALGEEVRPSSYLPDCFLTDELTPVLRDLFAAGTIYFQDEASQMVANAVEVPPNGRFLDVCAAPGGKTGLIAAKARDTFGVAGDIHRSRVEFLKANLARQGCGHLAVLQFDAESPLPFADRSFDAVLVDAPCSGSGTIRRNPEIRYSVTPEALAQLPGKQLNILTHASNLVKSGGLLIYSTCSLEPAENEEVATAFAANNTGFETVRPHLPDRFLTADGYARTWAHRDGMDGFFVAAFRRVG